ncbi:MAG: hypothetical protein HY897_07945 [Deltaproteobacteria bacterium]|nr:hypothetical protein [Deltaproteobacteria bacterium]
MKRTFLATALAALAAACGGRADNLSDVYVYLGPQPSGDTVFYLNKPLRDLMWLDTEARQMRRERLEFKTDLLVPLKARGLVGLVTFEGGMFRVFDAGARNVVREVGLGTAYDRYQVTPGGTHLIATSSLPPEALAESGVIGFLPGKVLVIDLAAFGLETIDVAWEVSQGTFVFPPAGSPGAGAVAAVLVPQGVIVFNYADASVAAASQELGFPGREPRPTAGVFSHDAKTLFVVADGSTDIFSVGIAQEGGRFRTSLNFLPSQAQLGQITTVPEPTLYNSVVAFYPDMQEVVVLDDNATISDELHIPVPAMLKYAGTILDEGGHPWVAVTCAGGQLKLINPTNGEVKGSALEGEIGWTKTVPETDDRYLVVEARRDNEERVAVVSLGTVVEEEVATTTVRLFRVVFTDVVAETLFSGTTTYMIFESAKKVARIDMKANELSDRDMPAPAFRGALLGADLVFVDHRAFGEESGIAGESGLVSVVDMAPGSAEDPWSVGGFLLGGFME